MLKDGQRIIYRVNDRELSTLVNENCARNVPSEKSVDIEQISPGLAEYVRFCQPFTQVGSPLKIPLPRGQKEFYPVTSKKIDKNRLIFYAEGKDIIIEYVGIDLQKILSTPNPRERNDTFFPN